MIMQFEHTVTDADTAANLGSGDLPVLATPRLINWCERAAFAAAIASTGEGQTTVGTRVSIEHVKGVTVGTTVHVRVSKPVNDGRRLIFSVTVTDDEGQEVAFGDVARAVVGREKFLSRCSRTAG